ncbi:hypothetical protein CMV30_14350 [Nibricoccus aquaticus]|uniref:DUF1570 domain-containing protein n=2 Tax=Nibricoccus aquaticus TaxID=2576891 RepID=A0A290Q8K9_9BACT|nr:hypothetical protein CMV30_14350 [Nibricoccus aquaticus]
MSRRAFFYQALLALLLVFTGESWAREWIYTNTGHFEVFTNSRPRDASVLIGRLEQFRENFLRILPGAPFREPRVTVVIFDSERDFRPYKPLYKGKPKEDLAGVFQGFPDEVVIALTTEMDLEQTIPVIFHEYVHLLMHARGYRLPPWLNEGVAELYSTITVENDQLKLGRDIPYHLMLLNRNKLMPLSQLFSITQSSPDYNEGTRRSLFYAQSWALLHYWDCGLAKEPQQFARKAKFLELLQMGLPADRSMQEAFGRSLADVERDLGAYVRGGKYYMRAIKVEKVDYAARVKFEPASDFKRDVALENLKWRLQQNGDATLKMLQFAEREPEAARPYELLAAMAMMDREPQRAIGYWQKAVERKSDNPYIYEQLAQNSLRQSMHAVSLNFRLPESAAAELRGWLDRAIELSPDYADAWDWLALTEAFSVKLRNSVVNKAIGKRELLDERPRFMAAISLIALRIDKKELAAQVADLLLARPDVQAVPSANNRITMDGVGAAAGGGSSWMLNREYYPDVRYIAQNIQRHLRSDKPAEDDMPEPAGFELRDAY